MEKIIFMLLILIIFTYLSAQAFELNKISEFSFSESYGFSRNGLKTINFIQAISEDCEHLI